jgi:phage-related protein
MEDRYQVLFYESVTGRCFAEEFLGSLPVKVRAKVSRWLRKLEECGPDLPRPYADIVRGKIRELRVIFASSQFRFLYFFYNRYIVISHGFIKKTGEVPENEIEKAENLMFDFQERVKKGDIKL